MVVENLNNIYIFFKKVNNNNKTSMTLAMTHNMY